MLSDLKLTDDALRGMAWERGFTLEPAGGINNPLLDVDSYKASHAKQYPPGTEYVYSYIESRGGEYDRTVLFGLQGFLKKYMCRPITMAMIDEAEIFWGQHGEPFYRDQWEYIVKKHNGYFPLDIRALPEGSVVNTGIPLVTIVNTDPACYWLVSFVETKLLRGVWYPTTVATNSFRMKEKLLASWKRTSTDKIETMNFKLHDFGARGVSSRESAAIGGAAHLVNFMGTDTVSAIHYIREFYNTTNMPAFSVPAAEHSTITSWGKNREVDAYRNMLTQFGKPGALVAVVSDSYDIWNAVVNIWGDTLKAEVLASGATIIVRPDSGDPLLVPIQVLEKLWEAFSGKLNDKGYRVLNPAVRVIQGDGITVDTLPDIIKNLEHHKFAIDNIAFGMGGGLLQQVNRDTYRFAMKCSAVMINGRWIDVYKSPVGDAMKASKRGRFSVIHENGTWEVVPAQSGFSWADRLQTVWINGNLVREQKFSDIRELASGKLRGE